ncbi:MAG: DUF3440 domain-containing protein [Candidatus Heimdallarchaeota archaeon]
MEESKQKQYLDIDVYTATKQRLSYIFEEFQKIYVSFSGGKDSSILLQMTLEIAREKNRLPIDVLFIDLEAQYKATISHVEEMLINNPEINTHWICLPLNLRNAVSSFQPFWQCWNPDVKDKWVRPLPNYDCVINDQSYFPFFKYSMEFEEFVVEFAQWFSAGENTACLVAIRTDESLNRFRTIKSTTKESYKGNQYSTKITEDAYSFYPIYDWRTEDIWTAVGYFNYKYNKIYDLMYQQGTSIHLSRLCQPYGDDQRVNLDLFRALEPETWAKVVDRVSGANLGNIYTKSFLLGHKDVFLPEGHTWKSYAYFLLDTIPRFEKEWYWSKFKVFFNWWEKNGFPFDEIPDDNLPKKHPRLLKPDGTFYRRSPSWKRICKCIMRNDKLCKSLTFTATKNQYKKYREMKELYGY